MGWRVEIARCWLPSGKSRWMASGKWSPGEGQIQATWEFPQVQAGARAALRVRVGSARPIESRVSEVGLQEVRPRLGGELSGRTQAPEETGNWSLSTQKVVPLSLHLENCSLSLETLGNLL